MIANEVLNDNDRSTWVREMEVFHWKLLEHKTSSGTYVHLWWEVEHIRSNIDKVKITQKDDQEE